MDDEVRRGIICHDSWLKLLSNALFHLQDLVREPFADAGIWDLVPDDADRLFVSVHPIDLLVDVVRVEVLLGLVERPDEVAELVLGDLDLPLQMHPLFTTDLVDDLVEVLLGGRPQNRGKERVAVVQQLGERLVDRLPIVIGERRSIEPLPLERLRDGSGRDRHRDGFPIVNQRHRERVRIEDG